MFQPSDLYDHCDLYLCDVRTSPTSSLLYTRCRYIFERLRYIASTGSQNTD